MVAPLFLGLALCWFLVFPRSGPRGRCRSVDAAGWLGYGAYLKGYWFAGSLAPSQKQQSIASKGLFPVIIAAHVLGHMWCKRQ